MRNVVVYVAGPYRAPTVRGMVENIRRAEAAALALWQCGIPALCPHTNTALFDGPVADEDFLQGGLIMLARCDAVLMLPGWSRSEGATAERERALELNLPVCETVRQVERWAERLAAVESVRP